MKTRILILWMAVSTVAAYARQNTPVPANTTIESVSISGISDTRLSSELNADIQKLAGQAFEANAVNELAQGIQIELPEYVAAVTTQPGTQADRIRVILVVAKISDNEALRTNINSRYIVDAVEVGGSFKAKISDDLNTELQAMVGKNLDTALAEELGSRIAKENESSSVDVSRKLRRGDSPQHVKVLYEVYQSENSIGFSFAGFGQYHSRQGFSAPMLVLSMHHRGAGGLTFKTANDPHTMVERYAGGSLEYDARRGPVRFGLQYSSYRAQWKENTLQADAQTSNSPGLYRVRDTIGSSLSVTLPLNLSISAGADFAGLQMQSPIRSYQFANAFKGVVSGTFPAREDGGNGGWGYVVRSGTDWLDSDFIYTSHEWKANYSYRLNSESSVSARLIAGRITGNAPMFERFSIGNGTTLRGWNKYEINPLGGDRVMYASAEYRYRFVTGFYDIGSVWDGGDAGRTRSSTGFSMHFTCKGREMFNPLCWISVGVGFPIHGEGARPSLLLGF